MLAADPATGEIRRFLTGPRGCEVTGVVTTPDGRTMFVNIQHPGETPSERSDPANPTAVSAWPGRRPAALGDRRDPQGRRRRHRHLTERSGRALSIAFCYSARHVGAAAAAMAGLGGGP